VSHGLTAALAADFPASLDAVAGAIFIALDEFTYPVVLVCGAPFAGLVHGFV